MTTLGKIAFGEESIELWIDGTWQPSSPEMEPLARMATALSKPPFYEYDPSDGAFGALLIHKVASKIGGRVEVPEPELSEEPEDIIF